MKNLIVFLFVILLFSCQTQQNQAVKLEGELLQWHKVTLVLTGAETSEWAKGNPFRNRH
jgi:hypothetical protein